MRISCDLGLRRPRVLAFALIQLALVVLAGIAFLADCGGSAFSSASGAGAGGTASGGSGASLNGGSGGSGSGGSGGSSAGDGAGASGSGSAGKVGRGGTGSAGGSGSGAAQGGEDAIGGVGGVGLPVSVCPASPPNVSSACVSGLSCSYGDDLRAECRGHYVCANGKWTPSVVSCTPLEDCFKRDAGFVTAGTACTDVGDECSFDGGISGTIHCRCGACVGTECKQEWDCQPPPAKPCPQLLPNEGQPCDTNDESCTYGMCSNPQGLAGMTCTAHVWKQTAGGCVTAGGA